MRSTPSVLAGLLGLGLLGSVLVAGGGVGAPPPSAGQAAAVETIEPAAATCRKAPRWKARKETRYGISLGSNGGGSMKQDLDLEEARFGTRVPVVRTWDDTLPTRTPWSEKKRWYQRRWVVTSIRVTPQAVLSGDYDGRLRQYFRTAPRKKGPIFWNYWHEPEDEIRAGQFTAGQYRRAWRHVARIAASFCRPNLYPTLVLMGWTANPAATPQWHEVNPGRKWVSVYAWDPYNGALGEAQQYLAPRVLYNPVVKASRSVNRPWAIAETGSVRVPGDFDGSGRAQWLGRVQKYAERKNAVFVTYYQSTRNGDFELRVNPELDVWRKAMQ
ncbi:hypothetical protein E8D34_20430 [Nocardioides sp. GY 10113]|uniref:hypothetical protein n=1 Tax=Nocardioides sp. GY 10113 TaxID=2569761 RepID=UPI0010A793AD|nr:hypothetical protein [Nocardioides sp. GY 10113]TIC79236.1 hypothetical protein E8D34_20430 [Nocardioides sp. GY 10113]